MGHLSHVSNLYIGKQTPYVLKKVKSHLKKNNKLVRISHKKVFGNFLCDNENLKPYLHNHAKIILDASHSQAMKINNVETSQAFTYA